MNMNFMTVATPLLTTSRHYWNVCPAHRGVVTADALLMQLSSEKTDATPGRSASGPGTPIMAVGACHTS